MRKDVTPVLALRLFCIFCYSFVVWRRGKELRRGIEKRRPINLHLDGLIELMKLRLLHGETWKCTCTMVNIPNTGLLWVAPQAQPRTMTDQQSLTHGNMAICLQNEVNTICMIVYYCSYLMGTVSVFCEGVCCLLACVHCVQCQYLMLVETYRVCFPRQVLTAYYFSFFSLKRNCPTFPPKVIVSSVYIFTWVFHFICTFRACFLWPLCITVAYVDSLSVR